MARTFRYSKQQVMDALETTRGLASLAARRLGCSHGTVLNYMQRYAEVKAVADGMRDAMTDVAELKFWRAIQRGEAWAITMQLKTQGRDRGYGEGLDFEVLLSQVVKALAMQYKLPLEEIMAEVEAIRRRRG